MRIPKHHAPASLAFALLAALAAPPRALAQNPTPAPQRQFLREVFKELIEIDTTDTERGDNTRAARAMAARLLAAGFAEEDVRVLVPAGNARKGNLVARLRGTDPQLKPLLLLAHIDVVEARREDWSPEFDPFKLTERDGYLYGRGTTDDKAMAAVFVANLIRLKEEGYRPARDIVVALTADEEGGQFNGVEFLLKNHRELIDAEYGINEGAGGQIKRGRKLLNGVQASEKVYQSFTLEAANRGGHSSVPRRDNAINQLSAALSRLAAYEFRVNLNEVTRAYFERMARLEQGQLASDMRAVARTPIDPAAVKRLSETPYYNALLRTTCVPTLLQGGHAENALPQTARATVNCRILPQETAEEVRQTLARVVADPQIKVTAVAESKPSPPSPLRRDVMGPIESITQKMWPGVPVVPLMGTGATDSLYLRQAGIPAYGVSGIFGDIEDGRAHGRDERILITSLHDSQEFLYRLTKALSSDK
jgi:acetylornithine deacetylase/succinyl-diaminopimelate desuccinylase-like protein